MSAAFEVLARASGAAYIKEPVSQLEHALQAAHFATKARIVCRTRAVQLRHLDEAAKDVAALEVYR